MKKLFFLAGALLCGAISANAVDYLVQTGNTGDATWSSEAITALGVAADHVIDLSKEGATLPTTGEIWFAGGEYEFTAQYAITTNAKLYGGFAGTETSVEGRALVTGGKVYEFVNPTIFSVTQPTSGDFVKMFPDQTGGVILDGLTIQGSKSTTDGGAIKVGSNSVVRNCTFLNNSTTAKGGAVLAYNVNNTIENCYFESNSSSQGGALYVATGSGSWGKYTMNVAHNVFVGNSSTGTGGALQIQGSCTITVDANIFYNNTSTGHSGAIYDNGGNISIITNNVVFNNSYLGSNNTCCYVKPKYFANNTICNNQGNVYFATNTDSAVVANNVIWGNKQGESASGVSFASATNGLTALNNYTSNTMPTNRGLVLSLIDSVDNTNYTVSLKNDNDTTKNSDDTEKIIYGPYFVKPTSFVGAIAADATNADELLAELKAADWSLQAKSALINAGTILDYVTTDILGTAREETGYDVGAYEYVEKGDIGSAFENTEKAPLDIQAALQAGEVYNILGQRVGDLQAGNIYIVNGQKILMR
ncbi:MAG: right-handed parallel beta-helix repeat-containing protein [Paludibacteraceae bacterium]